MAKIWKIPEYNTFSVSCKPVEKIEQFEKATLFFEKNWDKFANFWQFFCEILSTGRSININLSFMESVFKREEIKYFLGDFSTLKKINQLYIYENHRQAKMPKGINDFFEGREIPTIIRETYIKMDNNEFHFNEYMNIFLSIEGHFAESIQFNNLILVANKLLNDI